MTARGDYDSLVIKKPTKDRLTTFKEVAGLSFDEAINCLLDQMLTLEDEGSIARAGLRVRESREKDESLGNHKGRTVKRSDPVAVVMST